LTAELVLIKPTLTRKEIRRIATIDGIYGLAAVVLLVAGLTLWLGSYTKPEAYYSQNWIFLTKVGCFAIIGLLSIYPTVFFLRNRKGKELDNVTIPKAIFWALRMELMLLAIIPALAGLMARGMGMM
jgi:putative membrane protein